MGAPHGAWQRPPDRPVRLTCTAGDGWIFRRCRTRRQRLGGTRGARRWNQRGAPRASRVWACARIPAHSMRHLRAPNSGGTALQERAAGASAAAGVGRPGTANTGPRAGGEARPPPAACPRSSARHPSWTVYWAGRTRRTVPLVAGRLVSLGVTASHAAPHHELALREHRPSGLVSRKHPPAREGGVGRLCGRWSSGRPASAAFLPTPSWTGRL